MSNSMYGHLRPVVSCRFYYDNHHAGKERFLRK